MASVINDSEQLLLVTLVKGVPETTAAPADDFGLTLARPGSKQYTAEKSTVPHRAVHYRTVHYRTVQCRTVPHSTVQRLVQDRTIQYSTLQLGFAARGASGGDT